MINYKNLLVMLPLMLGSTAKANVRDIGLVGPNGQVSLFYAEGEDIIVKECRDHL